MLDEDKLTGSSLTAQMTEALEKIEGRDRVFEEEDLSSKTAHLHGVKRRIERTRDVDEIYESLKRNWFIHIFGLSLPNLPPGTCSMC